MKRIIFSLAAVLAMGCAHSKGAEALAAANPATVKRLRSIAAPAGAGALVLYRNTRFGSLFGPMTFNGTLWLDDQAVGDAHDDTFNVLTLPPGRHSLRVFGTAPGIVVPLQATTVINVIEGKVHFVELHSVQEFSNVT